MRIAVLIPAHNEAAAIAATVEAALAVEGVTRLIVVDDGSLDDTAQRARNAGAEVISLPENAGKGAALEAGADLADEADVFVLLDADLGETASQCSALVAPVRDGEADMAIAAFPRPAGKAGFGLVKGLARWGIRRLAGTGFEPEAPLSGQRAMTASCLRHVRPFASGYGVEVALTVRAMNAGCRIVEVPTTMAHAATGRDLQGFAHRGRQFIHVGAALIRLATQRTSGRG